MKMGMQMGLAWSVLLGASMILVKAGTQPTGYDSKLVAVQGDSLLESLPATVHFRFEVTLYVMPQADGPVEFLVSPYVPATDAPVKNDFSVSGEIAREKDGQETGSISAFSAETKINVELQAGEVYRIKLASLVDGNPGDKTASIIIPEGLAAAIHVPLDQPAWIEGITGFLWLPANCSEISYVGVPRLTVYDPDGTRSDLTTQTFAAEDAKKLPVRPDQTGQSWKVGNLTRGFVGIAGAPPWINFNGRLLLLPPDVR